jgi:hypothetical protein
VRRAISGAEGLHRNRDTPTDRGMKGEIEEREKDRREGRRESKGVGGNRSIRDILQSGLEGKKAGGNSR